MAWKTLDEMDVRDKRVLTRVDINVPVEGGRVTDTTRIDRIVPTVKDILARGGKPMLIAHFGRPKGKVNLEMSLGQVLPALQSALGVSVVLVETLEAAENLTQEALAADVILLENIRFHPGEEANDTDFARRLSGLGDIYCNDAFSAAHRAHASTAALARMLPACAGRLMQAELKALEAALSTPARPVGAVVGGAKVSTKIALLENLVNRLDVLVIGGGMANTFLAALGADLGNSLKEEDYFDTATVAAARTAAHQTREGAMVSVAGGGDTVAALNQAGAAEHFTYISTAGGAFLEWMEGKTLPGVAALEGR